MLLFCLDKPLLENLPLRGIQTRLENVFSEGNRSLLGDEYRRKWEVQLKVARIHSEYLIAQYRAYLDGLLNDAECEIDQLSFIANQILDHQDFSLSSVSTIYRACIDMLNKRAEFQWLDLKAYQRDRAAFMAVFRAYFAEAGIVQPSEAQSSVGVGARGKRGKPTILAAQHAASQTLNRSHKTIERQYSKFMHGAGTAVFFEGDFDRPFRDMEALRCVAAMRSLRE